MTLIAPKFELLHDDAVRVPKQGTLLYRLRALRSFGDVRAGDLGGYLRTPLNLSHSGLCWVYNDARVYDTAHVTDDAIIRDFAVIAGRSRIMGAAVIGGSARVTDSFVRGDAVIGRNLFLFGANIGSNADLLPKQVITGNLFRTSS